MLKQIFNIHNLEHRELIAQTTGEKYSHSAILSSMYNLENLFVTHEILKPGRKSSKPHAHSHKEEMIFILTGQPTVYLGEQIFELKPGDFIGFKPSNELHYLENHTLQEVHFLLLATNPTNDIVYSPAKI